MLFDKQSKIIQLGENMSFQKTNKLGLLDNTCKRMKLEPFLTPYTPEGWYGEGGGRGVQDGEHSVYLWQIHVDV